MAIQFSNTDYSRQSGREIFGNVDKAYREHSSDVEYFAEAILDARGDITQWSLDAKREAVRRLMGPSSANETDVQEALLCIADSLQGEAELNYVFGEFAVDSSAYLGAQRGRWEEAKEACKARGSWIDVTWADRLDAAATKLVAIQQMLEDPSLDAGIKQALLAEVGSIEQVRQGIAQLRLERDLIRGGSTKIDSREEAETIKANALMAESAFENIGDRLATKVANVPGYARAAFGMPPATDTGAPDTTASAEAPPPAGAPVTGTSQGVSAEELAKQRKQSAEKRWLRPDSERERASVRPGDGSYAENYELIEAALDDTGMIAAFRAGDPQLMEDLAASETLMMALKDRLGRIGSLRETLMSLMDEQHARRKKIAESMSRSA